MEASNVDNHRFFIPQASFHMVLRRQITLWMVMMKATRAPKRCAAEGIEGIRLVAKGLVNGVESTEDRRVGIVSHTPAGQGPDRRLPKAFRTDEESVL